MLSSTAASQEFFSNLDLPLGPQTFVVESGHLILSYKNQSVNLKLSFQLVVSWAYLPGSFVQITFRMLQSNHQEYLLQLSSEEWQQLKRLLDGRVLYTQLGQEYSIKQLLSRHPQGKVFMGENIRTKDIVAVKLLRCIESENEIKILKLLARHPHPNLVCVKEFYCDKDSYQVVFQFCYGSSLGQWLKAKKLSLDQLKSLMGQVLKGLDHLHSLGVMHRDVKPENFLIDQLGGKIQIRLADFSLATLERQKLNKCGSPGFIAPEIFERESYGELCDVYSAGALFHMLATGKPMFKAGQNVMLSNRKNEIKPDKQLKDLPGAVEFFTEMVAKADKRPAAFECLLHPFLNESETTTEIEENNLFQQVSKLNGEQINHRGLQQ